MKKKLYLIIIAIVIALTAVAVCYNIKTKHKEVSYDIPFTTQHESTKVIFTVTYQKEAPTMSVIGPHDEILNSNPIIDHNEKTVNFEIDAKYPGKYKVHLVSIDSKPLEITHKFTPMDNNVIFEAKAEINDKNIHMVIESGIALPYATYNVDIKDKNDKIIKSTKPQDFISNTTLVCDIPIDNLFKNRDYNLIINVKQDDIIYHHKPIKIRL